MTELLITPNFDKKAAKFKGTVAAGETVLVRIANAQDIDTENLRLRVLDLNGKTLAMFERHYLEDGAEDGWQNDGEYLTCMLDLNTVEMQTAVCGMCERDLLVVLDDPENDILHFKGECAFQGWPKRKGGDIPYELGEYPDIVENLKSRVNEAEKSIADHVDEADGIVAQANNVKNAAVKAEEAARLAAAYADTAKEEAERQAQSAAKSADDLQVAVEEAERHKNAAQEAQSAAETARDEAVAAKNAAENARDNAETVAEESAQRLVAAEKTRAEMAENEIRGKVATLIASDTDKSARSIAAEEVAKVVANAPADLDTLKEIAAYIESDKTGAAAIEAKISKNSDEITLLNEGKVDKVAGKGLSTNDYTAEEKEKLDGIETGAQKNPDLTLYAKKTELAPKRDRTDNIAAKDEVQFTEWKFRCDVPEIQAALDANPPVLSHNPNTGPSGGQWLANGGPKISGFQGPSGWADGAVTAESIIIYDMYMDLYTGLTISPVTATRERIVTTKSGEPYVTPTGVKNIAIPKYEFITSGLQSEGDDYFVTLEPYHCTVLKGECLTYAYFKVAVGGKSGSVRDCILMVDLTSMEYPPTITWPTNFHPRTDAETDFVCVAGKRNVYWITEYASGEFCVAGWQETEGGNAS